MRLITNCFPNKKLKRFIERGETLINDELDYMKVIKHVKENKMRFYPTQKVPELAVDIDRESSGDDQPFFRKWKKQIEDMNHSDHDCDLGYKKKKSKQEKAIEDNILKQFNRKLSLSIGPKD